MCDKVWQGSGQKWSKIAWRTLWAASEVGGSNWAKSALSTLWTGPLNGVASIKTDDRRWRISPPAEIVTVAIQVGLYLLPSLNTFTLIQRLYGGSLSFGCSDLRDLWMEEKTARRMHIAQLRGLQHSFKTRVRTGAHARYVSTLTGCPGSLVYTHAHLNTNLHTCTRTHSNEAVAIKSAHACFSRTLFINRRVEDWEATGHIATSTQSHTVAHKQGETENTVLVECSIYTISSEKVVGIYLAL